MKNIRSLAILMALLIGIPSALTGCSASASVLGDAKDSTKTSGFDSSKGIVSQGVIESKEISINSKLAGRILKINVEEGQEVKAGDVLVEISSDELQAKKKQAEANLAAQKAARDASKSEADAAANGCKASQGQVDAANSQATKAENGARPQEVAQAQAQYDIYLSTYNRVKDLFDHGAASAQSLDEVKTKLEVARQQLSMAKEGARSEDKSGAQAVLAQTLAGYQASLNKADQAKAGLKAREDAVVAAQGVVDEVNAYLKDTIIKAPTDGVITAINAHEGELVSTGMSIGTISDLKSSWVEVKVKETDLEKISVGQKIDVKVPSYSKKDFTGKVVRINQKPDFATKRSTNDNGDFDIQAFGIKIELDNKDSVLRPGMTAFVQFKK